MFKSGEDQRIGYKNGYPILYEKFVTSVIENDVQDIICPFPYPSTVAFKILKDIFSKIDIQADFIFIDGNHTAAFVLTDALMSWYTLKPGGIMVFDDYLWGAPDTKNSSTTTPKLAVDSFISVFKDYLEVLFTGPRVAIKKLS
jgi:hypothetical protein